MCFGSDAAKPTPLFDNLITMQSYTNTDQENNRLIRRRISTEATKAKSPDGYFTAESLFLLACLTVSLLFLPLMLPPLPPPPSFLLIVPIGIMMLLVFMAFMPSNVRDIATRSYL
ncbi:hypothetical protein LUZ60_015901 [Juncus effusus]|nr:hypothetical protein LUZ60_015901 [Juncus effusus]